MTRTGLVVEWDNSLGGGLIRVDGSAKHLGFVSSYCCLPLLAILSTGDIPPNPSVPVQFDLDLDSQGIVFAVQVCIPAV